MREEDNGTMSEKRQLYSIGVVTGRSPFELGPSTKWVNPVITREDVSDVQALFVADPFMLRVDDVWYMFFEIFNGRTGKGEIGFATSRNCSKWEYQMVVLREPFHLSYPYVFRTDNEVYMMPESRRDSNIRLYRAKDFPMKWEFAGTLLSGQRFGDSSILHHGGRWWLFTETNPNLKHDTLRLFHADSLYGEWKEHPCSPVVRGNPHIARPAGRVCSYDGKVVRYAQDCYPIYGTRVKAFVVTELTETAYAEEEIATTPVLGPSEKGWNAGGMHHVDPHEVANGEWIACVDGWVGVDSLRGTRRPTVMGSALLRRIRGRLPQYPRDAIKRRLQGYIPSRVAGRIKALLGGGVNEIDRLKVVSLTTRGRSRGDVLLSYIIDGFLVNGGQPLPTTHTNIWASVEIANIFLDLGFNVDVIHYRNKDFIPKKPYAAMLDVRDNLERLSPFLPSTCVKIMHLDTKNLLFHNLAEAKRLLDLQQRKGTTLKTTRLAVPNQSLEHANCGISTGDRFTIETFAYAGKPVYSVPIPASVSVPWPEHKKFDACRKRFVWFGSSGFVLKGLDLVLEAFAEMPEYQLIVCGDIQKQSERKFVQLYYRELYQTANIRTIGWVDVNNPEFREIADSCVATILVSGSEGGSASTINCMHAALIPVVGYETRMDVGEFGFVLKESSIEEIKDCVRRVAELPAVELTARSRKAWEYARDNHTREKFSAAYRKIIEEIIETHGCE